MQTKRHPIEPEELMAYLDGELSASRAGRAATHLDECRECQTLAAELRGVSERLMEWRVEAPVMVAPVVMRKSWYRQWKPWAVAAALALIALFVQAPRLYLQKQQATRSVFDLARTAEPLRVPGSVSATDTGFDYSGSFGTAFQTRVAQSINGTPGPLIAHGASLSIAAKNFDSARTRIDQILKHHNGYAADMTVNAAAESARTLNASLRTPDGQLDATITELKALGRVLIESRTGEEVTQQSLDLNARLSNARNAEQRLTELLKTRTGKLSDVLEVENQISATRGQIEQMEAERKNLDRRIQYAKIDLTLTEKYEPPTEHGPLRKAAAEGYRALAGSLVGAAALVLSAGPVVLFWGAILGLPAWYAWRRYRR